jgi:hypothetical protein
MTNQANNPKEIQKIIAENKERLKELAAINKTSQLIKEGKNIDETLQQIVMLLPEAWQYPEYTVARIKFDNKQYVTQEFQETKWIQRQSFDTIDQRKGAIEVYYTKEFVELDEGPFLKEERDLIHNLSGLICGYLNSISAKEVLSGKRLSKLEATISEEAENLETQANRKLLQRFLNKNNYARDIYHDLMPFKVREILLVANLYDAYSIEKEGRFSEHVLGEYHQLNLTSMPRITGVSTPEEAFEQLYSKHFDLVIFMMGTDKTSPMKISKRIKKEFPYIPVFALLNNNTDISILEEKNKKTKSIDRIFVWNGDSKVFFAMIKHVEDKINVENDTKVGLVRVILVVEDSAKFYSRYLPLLYSIVLDQTKRIIEDVSTDELYKILRMRARPKILLASEFEEAMDIFNMYKDNMLCLITDVKYKKNGIHDPNAGFSLVKEIRSELKDLPTIIQSSDSENRHKAYELKTSFIDKNSDSLVQDFKSFITHYLGFGNFIYRDKSGRQIAVAKSLKEFEHHLRTIPIESLVYHAKKDHFSLWLMARGEIQVAKIINPAKVTDFKSPEGLREYMIETIQKFRNEQNKGKVIPFEESAITDESNIISLSDGALGGKGRGLAFINTIINNFDFSKLVPDIKIRTPKTSIIGTEEYELFLERNNLLDKILSLDDYTEVRKHFLEAKFSESLIRKLRAVLKHIKNPIAIRSSGLFEDSLMQPFAGIFETYILPNNHPELKVRLNQCMDAIKMVYASVFSKTARGYIEAINYKIEEEKMAVVIQEVVGNRYDDVFYPHFSGVAQSYNYYPIGHMKPEDGFAVLAIGLGRYVVEGEKAYRFCPVYPNMDIVTPKDLYKNSQLHFYAVDLSKKDINLMEGEEAGLIKLDISDSERHDTLKHMASVYNPDNDNLTPGVHDYGPRVVNFADILKYEYIPLSKTIEAVLDIVKEAMGTPVEIEFAVDLNKDKDYRASFYLLQIKPLIGNREDYKINIDKIDQKKIILYTDKGMGNGKITNLKDVIYINRENFDKSKTEEMAQEIEQLNEKMKKENKKYVLIGPGRWGTRDRWIGIPVAWPQISNAKIIVETDFHDYPLDGSSGSHFFHNVTTMNVGYFTVHHAKQSHQISWEKLDNQKVIEETKYFKHVEFDKSFEVLMDGKKRVSVILNK